uniref:Inter-alpha-trypsin inhibitor heavy chain C-terminal domain-containing protein n=1 Tax=Nothobranchius korthausae TaxID=1143690 RepID=A0A1A8HL46_9TELE
MVVTKPETEDATASPLIADKLTEEQRQQAEKAQIMGTSYLSQMTPIRSYMSQMTPMSSLGSSPTYFVDGDPHFMIELPNRNDALCFNINDTPGTIFNLVRDSISDFWGEAGDNHSGNFSPPRWQTGDNVDLLVTKDGKLTVTLKDSVKFVILLHKGWKKHPYHRDYLGIYTVDTHLMSPSVHGLLGQFYHGIDFEVTNLHPGEDPEKPDATMFVKGQEINVTRGWQRDFRRNWKGENVSCWFVHNNGLGLIDGVEADYIVSDLFTAV